jgi:hypothetical protein
VLLVKKTCDVGSKLVGVFGNTSKCFLRLEKAYGSLEAVGGVENASSGSEHVQ